MATIVSFWLFTLAMSAAVFFVVDARFKAVLSALYRPFVMVAFSVATLSCIRLYLHEALSGNSDAAIGLHIHQFCINPVVYILADLGIWRLIDISLEPLPDLYIVGCPGNSSSVVLWEVMVADLFLGNLFWLFIGSFWLRISKRKGAVA